MAMSLNGSRRSRSRHLICAVCQEVYRSPRLLPCHHSFCSNCLERLTRVRGGGSFLCPVCRSTIGVPPSGALGFQANFHIDEEELEMARNETGSTMCSAHGMEPLVFFCVQCDQAICIRCKLTKHDHHETQDLSEAAARCQDQLQTAKDRLESTVNCLTKKSAEAHDNLKAAREKGELLKEQVRIQHNTLVARVGRLRDAVLDKVDKFNTSVRDKVSTDTSSIQQELDSLMQLRQSVHHALGDASDAEKVQVEKEMREGQGSVERLDAVRNSVPGTTARPGLHYDQSAVSDDEIRRLLGSPVELSLPSGPVTEVVVPIYQCGQEGACREVHSVCHVYDDNIKISFGGTLPHYAGEAQIKITVNGNKIVRRRKKWEKKNTKVMFVKFSEKRSMYCCSKGKTTKPMFFAKNEVLIKSIKVDPNTTQFEKLTVNSFKPLKTSLSPLFSISSERTVAFDATKDEQLFVIIEEKTTEQSQQAEYSVLLFHLGQSDPFTTYQQHDAGFLPTDVCFWQEDGRQKLLVADAQNDSVHVVNVEEDACHFERYLAAGNSHLVRPTALNVDDRNRVWIGCGNGWILRCEKLQESEELPCDEDGDSNESDGSVESFVIGDNSLQPMEVDFVPTVMHTRSDVSSSISHASLPVLPFLSPASVSIRSDPSHAASIASDSSVVTEISIRSTDTLRQLSDDP